MKEHSPNMARSAWLWGTFLLLFATPVSRADLIVTIEDGQIQPGGSALINVFVKSTGTDQLLEFGFDIRIATSGLSQLKFVDPQPTGYLVNPDYVFFGDSTSTGATVDQSGILVPPGERVVGGDGTLSGNDVTVTPTNVLLAQLLLTAATGTFTPVPGDTFTISLVPGSSASAFTFFENSSGSVAFDSVAGTVVVVSAAVPEPSSLLFVAIGVSGAFLIRMAGRWTTPHDVGVHSMRMKTRLEPLKSALPTNVNRELCAKMDAWGC